MPGAVYRPVRRLAQLYAGLVLYGASMALQIRAGVGLDGLAGAAYIGAGLGPGPRDGLMTGVVRRTGRSVGLVRTGIELTVLAAGAALGGTVGVGTVVYALAIGPLAHVFVPAFTVVAAAPSADV